jgi:hypothetical protein
MAKRNKKTERSTVRKKVDVVIGDWLKLKPYKTANNHDIKYLRLSQEIYQMLGTSFVEELKNWGYKRENLVEISVVLASYVEDFASEIGLWKAFTDYNKEQFGSPLPFFEIEKEEYFENDLNPQDLSYLIWHYSSAHLSDGVFPPYRFSVMGEAVYDLIEPKIEELSVTNYYENFLKVADNEDFWVLKDKFKWLALNSYLVGIDFGKEHGKQAKDVNDEIEKMLERKEYEGAKFMMENGGMLLYQFMNEFIYYKNSKFAALNVPIWLSKIIRASEKAKARIADFYKFSKGYFKFISNEKTHYLFEELRTGRRFEVAKDSFEPTFLKKTPVGTEMEMSIFFWNDQWYMSGGVFSDTKNGVEIDKSKPVPYYLYPEDVKPKVFGMIEEMRDIFIDLYGSPLVLCENKADLGRVINGFYKANNEKVAKENSDLRDRPTPSINLDNVKGKDFAVFFHSTQGLSIKYGANELVALLNAKVGSLTEEEKEAIFHWYHVDFDSEEFIQYLSTNFPTKNLESPNGLFVDVPKDSAYLRRFFHPEDYEHTPIPRNSIVSSKKFESFK